MLLIVLNSQKNCIPKEWLYENVYYCPFLAFFQECWNFQGPNLFQVMLCNYPGNYVACATLVSVLFTTNYFWQHFKCHLHFFNKHVHESTNQAFIEDSIVLQSELFSTDILVRRMS